MIKRTRRENHRGNQEVVQATQIIHFGIHDCTADQPCLFSGIFSLFSSCWLSWFSTEFPELNRACSYIAFPRRVSLLKMSVHVVLPDRTCIGLECLYMPSVLRSSKNWSGRNFGAREHVEMAIYPPQCVQRTLLVTLGVGGIFIRWIDMDRQVEFAAAGLW